MLDAGVIREEENSNLVTWGLLSHVMNLGAMAQWANGVFAGSSNTSLFLEVFLLIDCIGYTVF